jgi:MraZ protein
MSAPSFYSHFRLKLDAKNRLFVPADVRRVIDSSVHGKAFYVILGSNDKLWLYTEKYYESQGASIAKTISPGKAQLDYMYYKFALADRIEWDEQGRMVMPEEKLKDAKLQKDVALVGAVDHLELWNQAEWAAYRLDLMRRKTEVEQNGMQAIEAARAAEALRK